MSSNILTAFNDHFVEFISDIQNVFPEDHDILVAKNSLLAIRKMNFLQLKYRDPLEIHFEYQK